MPLLNSVTKIALKPFPNTIDPRAHAVIDYINVGAFLVGALAFWRRNRRAAIGSLVAGGTALLVNLLTDYPGGAKKIIKFHLHRNIDFGLATMTATLPEFLAFDGEGEKMFFVAEGILISAITELSRFPQEIGRPEKRRFAA
ncbi:MAG TPA: hypothetical protein VFA85_13355 [Terriglobales bacterium]|nr:hypothetical protein [Terriglobales bacterium]